MSERNKWKTGDSSLLRRLGISTCGHIYRNLSVPELVEHALARDEGLLATNGGLAVRSGKYTGRFPDAKFIVRDETTEDDVWWEGPNQAFTDEAFERIFARIATHFATRDLHVFDGFAVADPKLRMPVRIVTEKAWQALFAHAQFLEPTAEMPPGDSPHLTVLAAPELSLLPDMGTDADAGIILSMKRRLVLIAGTGYSGEIKKSVFTYLNYRLPELGVLPMHCAANIGADEETALFFGLSGTGKTTLSADAHRRLIGDDEHGWSEDGVFNFEGGCYAKLIGVSPETEPEVYSSLRFGSVLENVVLDEQRVPNYFDGSITENTRGTYSLENVGNVELSGQGKHPKHVVFLALDAFGVLPPIAKLKPEQAIYQFISGYTAKVAGTEDGVVEPKAVFAACFGLPFLPRHPAVYARLLSEKAEQAGSEFWLLNTGWSGGPHGIGKRIPLQFSRAMLHAALAGELDRAGFAPDPTFGILTPKSCPGVPREILTPRSTWRDPAAYDRKAHELGARFRDNFRRFEHVVPAEVRAAGFGLK